jgi:non-ribosomal peptide synthetase component F
VKCQRADAPRRHDLLSELIAQRPGTDGDRVALAIEGDTLSYADLHTRSNQLAHALRRAGVGPDVLVGVVAERSFEMVIGLVAIIKAGGAYVPIDPGYPAERLAFMLEDCHAPIVLTQAHLRS